MFGLRDVPTFCFIPCETQRHVVKLRCDEEIHSASRVRASVSRDVTSHLRYRRCVGAPDAAAAHRAQPEPERGGRRRRRPAQRRRRHVVGAGRPGAQLHAAGERFIHTHAHARTHVRASPYSSFVPNANEERCVFVLAVVAAAAGVAGTAEGGGEAGDAVGGGVRAAPAAAPPAGAPGTSQKARRRRRHRRSREARDAICR